MPGRDRLLVIWNASAGGGSDADRPKRREELVGALTGAGLDFELIESSSETETEQRVDQARSEDWRAVVAAGGDGTVRSVAFRLLGGELPLGILPLGTAMNVARAIGIPLELAGAATVLAEGRVRRIDVGEVRGQPFLEIASIGLGADVLAGATEARDGRLAAVIGVLQTAWHYRRTRIRLQLDGHEVRGRAPFIAVANGPYTGRGMELAPDARIDDGKFDVLVFEGFGGLQLAGHLVRLLLGRRRDPRIRRYRAATVQISARRPLPVRLDSKDLGTTPVELRSRAAALVVLAPVPVAASGRPSAPGGTATRA